MNTPPPISPRRRLQELLAIPDKQRTEAEWDELVELEISMAPGNREDGQDRRPRPMPQANNGNPKSNDGGPPKKHFRKFHKKPPKPGPV